MLRGPRINNKEIKKRQFFNFRGLLNGLFTIQDIIEGIKSVTEKEDKSYWLPTIYTVEKITESFGQKYYHLDELDKWEEFMTTEAIKKMKKIPDWKERLARYNATVDEEIGRASCRERV